MDDLSFETAKSAKALMSDIAYEAVKSLILNNDMPGGYQILEDDLARNLQMSRTPLREALIRLEHEGLIDLIPRHGIRVLPLSTGDLHEIYQILMLLESFAAALIANKRPNDDEVAILQQAIDDMFAALDGDDLAAWAMADARFHRALVQHCGNRRLALTACTYLDQSQRFRTFTLRLRDKPINSTQSHADLVAAIRDHDAARARIVHEQQKADFGREMDQLMAGFKIRQL